MPDFVTLLHRRWKWIAALTLAATGLAVVVSLLRSKEYVGTVTALPANSATTDKARLLNPNIEGLYPELGSADELDRIEGTAQLDTLYLAVAKELSLPAHYAIKATDSDVLFKAANRLRKQTAIKRSAYGELKISVWDGDAAKAAQMANALLQKLNELHGALVQANNEAILKELRKSLVEKERQMDSLSWSLSSAHRVDTVDSSSSIRENRIWPFRYKARALEESITKLNMMIEEYSLAVSLRPKLLLPVEGARPALRPDRPKTLQTAAFAFGASLLFSALLALIIESRKHTA